MSVVHRPRSSSTTSSDFADVPLHHVWSVCTSARDAQRGVARGLASHFREAVKTLGARYVRFHGLFHDDMFVYRASNGGGFGRRRPWRRPSSPSPTSTRSSTPSSTSAPARSSSSGFMPRELRDADRDALLVEGALQPSERHACLGGPRHRHRGALDRAVRHRRGAHLAVRDLERAQPRPALLDGHSHRILPAVRGHREGAQGDRSGLKVGGPSSSVFVPDSRYDGEYHDKSVEAATAEAADPDALPWKPVWIHELIAYCAERDLPLDFLSTTHLYPTDYAFDTQGVGRSISRRPGCDTQRPRGHAPDDRGLALPGCRAPRNRVGPRRRPVATTCTTRCTPRPTSHGPFCSATTSRTPSRTGRSPTSSKRAAAASARSMAASGSSTSRASTSRRSTRWRRSTGSGTASPFRPSTASSRERRRMPSPPCSSTTRTRWARGRSAVPRGTRRRAARLREGPARRIAHVVDGLIPGDVYAVEILDQDHGNVAEAWHRIGEPLNLSLSAGRRSHDDRRRPRPQLAHRAGRRRPRVRHHLGALGRHVDLAHPPLTQRSAYNDVTKGPP